MRQIIPPSHWSLKNIPQIVSIDILASYFSSLNLMALFRNILAPVAGSVAFNNISFCCSYCKQMHVLLVAHYSVASFYFSSLRSPRKYIYFCFKCRFGKMLMTLIWHTEFVHIIDDKKSNLRQNFVFFCLHISKCNSK